MPTLKNPRQEKFAQLVLKGEMPDYVAYTAAGYTAATQEVARANAARLIADDSVAARIRELRQPLAAKVEEALQITTVEVARRLWQMGTYDARKALRITTTGRGRNVRTTVTLKPPDDWPPEIVQACEGFEIKPDGTVKLSLAKKTPALVRVGEHLGMFQGEAAGIVGGTTNIQNNDNRTVNVFVDKPRDESVEEWKNRVARERGIKQGGTTKETGK